MTKKPKYMVIRADNNTALYASTKGELKTIYRGLKDIKLIFKKPV